MRVIKKGKLAEFFRKHQQGKQPLLNWHNVVKRAHWRSLAEMRATFPSADEVRVASGRKAVVFDIKGGYRLITAVHYQRTVRDQNGKAIEVEGKVYLFYFLTHAEYDKESWKVQL